MAGVLAQCLLNCWTMGGTRICGAKPDGSETRRHTELDGSETRPHTELDGSKTRHHTEPDGSEARRHTELDGSETRPHTELDRLETRPHTAGGIQELQFCAMDYLLKTEPSTYSFADLQREKSTIWDGVTNPVALKNLRNMKPGERLVIYHTGEEKSAVGTATVVSVDDSDPKNPKVTIKVGKAIAKPVTLAEAKANRLFADSPLVRQGRLSVVPLTTAQYKALTGD